MAEKLPSQMCPRNMEWSTASFMRSPKAIPGMENGDINLEEGALLSLWKLIIMQWMIYQIFLCLSSFLIPVHHALLSKILLPSIGLSLIVNY